MARRPPAKSPGRIRPPASRTPSGPTRVDLVRSLRALAARAETELAKTAQEASIHWSFQVQRGPRVELLMEAGGSFDMVFVAAARRNAGPGLLDRRRARESTGVYTLFTGSAASERSLAAALSMVGAGAGELAVLVVAKDAQSLSATRAQAIERLKGEDVVVRFLDCLAENAEELAAALIGLSGRALFLPADLELSRDRSVFRDLLERIDCLVVLVR